MPEQLVVPPAIQDQPATEDQRLVAGIQRKDRKATADFVSRHADAIYRYVCARLVPHTVDLRFAGSVLQGVAQGKALPAQPFGSGRFYGVWFVRTDTKDKAFLGALIANNSIILSDGGEGDVQFAATHFTTGPHAGSPITFGSAGTNLVVVLIESNINGLTPSPVGPVPGTGLALVGTF